MRGRGRMPGWNVGGASVFNPATLSLSGWWRGSYSASPWSGTASAGGSGSQSLSELSTPPAVGAAVNGFTPVSFDGVDDQLSGASTSTFVSASAYFWWALFYSAATGGSNAIAGAYLNPGLFSDSGGWLNAALRNNAGTEYVQVLHADSGRVGNEHAISLNTWNLVCARYDGSNIRSKLNSGSVVVSAAVGAVGNVAVTLYAGRNFDGSARMTGRILDFGFMSTAESDARFDDIKSYANARYALSL